MEATQVSTNDWPDKQNVVCIYIQWNIFRLKKEGDSDTYYNMNFENIMLNEIS
jgi:hypothetical protein